MHKQCAHAALFTALFFLSACATPATLMRSKPALSGTFPGHHGTMARCAVQALEDYYATAWSYDLREFPGKHRTQLLVRVFGTDTILVADFLQKETGTVAVTVWQRWDIIYNPKGVLWEAAKRCRQNPKSTPP